MNLQALHSPDTFVCFLLIHRQISANTSVKTIEGNFTCYTKSVITKPQNVMVLRDIMCNGYVAGGNTKFFGSNGEKLGKDNPMTPRQVADAVQERLAYTDDLDGDYGSILAFLAPYSEVEQGARDQVISITDRLLPWEVTKGPGLDKGPSGFPGGPGGFNAYRTEYGLHQIHFGEDVRSAENMEFISNGSVNNSTCILGPHRRYSPYSQNFYELIPGQGHFGPGTQTTQLEPKLQTCSHFHSHKPTFDSLHVQTPFLG